MLHHLQTILIRALHSADPLEVMAQLLDEYPGNEEEISLLRNLDEDGLRFTALMVQKLRFERLTRANDSLAQLFATNPEEFLDLFCRFTAEVPPSAYFPEQEARLLSEWQQQEQS